MKSRKVGVWLIGALGSISSMVVAGTAALRRGLAAPTGMVSVLEPFGRLDLAGLDRLVFGGCDIRAGSLRDEALAFAEKTGALDRRILQQVEDDLLEADRHVRAGTVRNCGDAIRRLASSADSPRISVREEIVRIAEQLRSFKRKTGADTVVVVNLASTEPPLAIDERHLEPDALERSIERNESEAVRASTIYAYAAIREGCPYVNFTPSNGSLPPALVRMAEARGVPVMGNDGKTGETLVKSALAPLFVCRNLEVLSWEGFNLLGNMDGAVLENSANRESKIKTKDGVLSRILGYTPHSRVRIDYVPSLDDQKTAWDFVHFRGFLGTKMTVQFIWQGYDSILAAPLVIDLVRFAEFAARNGESGLMPHLASYFKEPLGVDEYRLQQQFEMLLDYARAFSCREGLDGPSRKSATGVN